MSYFDENTTLTNNTLKKMRDYNLPLEAVREAFLKPTREEWSKVPVKIL
jgi:hypothetical protein